MQILQSKRVLHEPYLTYSICDIGPVYKILTQYCIISDILLLTVKFSLCMPWQASKHMVRSATITVAMTCVLINIDFRQH